MLFALVRNDASKVIQLFKDPRCGLPLGSRRMSYPFLRLPMGMAVRMGKKMSEV